MKRIRLAHGEIFITEIWSNLFWNKIDLDLSFEKTLKLWNIVVLLES